jgi:hypothetical protein
MPSSYELQMNDSGVVSRVRKWLRWNGQDRKIHDFFPDFVHIREQFAAGENVLDGLAKPISVFVSNPDAVPLS